MHPVAKAKAPPRIPGRRNLQRQLSPGFCFLFFSGTSFSSLELEALKIPPKFVPREHASPARRLWNTAELDGGGLCIAFKRGQELGGGVGAARDFRKHKSTAKSRKNSLLRCWTKK